MYYKTPFDSNLNFISQLQNFTTRHCTIATLHHFIGLPSNPCFLSQNTCFLRQYSLLPGVLLAEPWVVRGGGFPCVSRRRLQHRTRCYTGVQFNLLAQSPIPDPSLVPVTKDDCGAELRGLSVSRTTQWRYRCVCLPTPRTCERGSYLFSAMNRLSW